MLLFPCIALESKDIKVNFKEREGRRDRGKEGEKGGGVTKYSSADRFS